jgi:Cadherin domain
VEAVDSDSGVNSRIEYRILSGDPRGQFAVNRTHGHVSVAAALDREMVNF